MYNNLNEALEAKMDLAQRVSSIDQQLTQRGNKAKTTRYTLDELKEYLHWRESALAARNVHINKLQRTKLWIKQERQRQAAERLEKAGGPDALMADLYDLTKSLLPDTLDGEDQALLDNVQSYLSQG